jgi:putative addiction module CopG family antidote
MSTYTVNISLPKKLADLAHDQVKKGYYGSLSEVIRDALRNLFEPEIPTYKMTKRMIKNVDQAWKEYKAGKTIPLKNVKDLDLL